MEMKSIETVETAEEARSIAIDWQHESSNVSMSWGDVAEYQSYFTELANKFDLNDEFTENGII